LESSSQTDKFVQILKSSTAVVVSEKEIDFSSKEENKIFVLIVSGSSEGGGRIGAIGSRSVSSLYEFVLKDGHAELINYIGDARARNFSVPYFVARMPVYLPDGSEIVLYGAVDLEAVLELERNIKIS